MNRKTIGYLAAFAATFTLQGCLEDASYRFDTPPNAAPLSILFTDTSLGEGIGGAIEVTRAPDEASFSSYMIRWGTDGVAAGDASGIMLNGELNFIAKINKQREDIVHFLPADTPIPEGVNGIVVSSHNALGESVAVSVDIDNLIYIPRTPETRASNLSVTDNNVFAIIDADLSFETAINQDDIEFYFLRFANENGCPIAGAPVATYPASDEVLITDSTYMDYPPNNATNLLLVSGNQEGEHAESDCADYISAPEGTWNQIDYNQPARFAPASVTVTDIDPSLSLSLEIVVEPSQYELDIRHYSVYLGSDANCSLLGELPKGGGTITHALTHEEYSQTESSPFFPDWVSYPNQIVTVVSDGENCFQDPKLSKTYQEESGVWHLIYLVEGQETLDINSHYNSIRIPYDAGINDAWDATCLSVDGDDLVTASCNKDDGKQRFAVRNAENPENIHHHMIESLFNQKCFQRTSDEGEHDWLLADCDDSTSQLMELKSNGVDLYNKKIAVNRNETEQSCASATSGRNDVYGAWNNCEATSDIYWQFWEQAMPSNRQRFEE